MNVTNEFHPGDHVRITDGTFVGHDAQVVDVNVHYGLVTVELILFERRVPVSLQHWQIRKIPEN
jgi:transcription antitermination factor NusG